MTHSLSEVARISVARVRRAMLVGLAGGAVLFYGLPARAANMLDGTQLAIFNGPNVNVQASLETAMRWSAYDLFNGGLNVAIAPNFAQSLGAATPEEIDDVNNAVRSAFAAWENNALRFNLNFDAAATLGPASGFDIDLLALPTSNPVWAGNSSYGQAAVDRAFETRPLANGQFATGFSIRGADVYVNIERTAQFAEQFNLTREQQLAALTRLVMHEVGHTIGLGHPGDGPNYDIDTDPYNPMPINPQNPFANVIVSPNNNLDRIMSSGATGVSGPALLYTELQYDDAGGRDLLYPSLGSGPPTKHQVIFSVDPTQSFFTASGGVLPYGGFVEQAPGSMTANVDGHFLVEFNPQTGVVLTMEFLPGHGYLNYAEGGDYQPGGGPANFAAQTSGGQVTTALRDFVWDWSSAQLTTTTPGTFTANTTQFIGLSGSAVIQDPFGTNQINLAGFADLLDGGQWTMVESSPGSGQWTLTLTGGQYTYPVTGVDAIGYATLSGQIVATAQFGVGNFQILGGTETSAQALGGAGTVGGVSASFSTAPGAGIFAAQQIPLAGISLDALLAGQDDPLFALSTDDFLVDPQIWQVTYDGDLLGATLELLFHYDATLLPTGVDEAMLGIWHFNALVNQWEFGGTVDTLNDTIWVTTNHLSEFMLGLQPVPEPSAFVLLASGTAVAGCLARRRSRRAKM